jgi:hypothetical protein
MLLIVVPVLLHLMFFHDVVKLQVEDLVAKAIQNQDTENLVSLMNQDIKAHTELRKWQRRLLALILNPAEANHLLNYRSSLSLKHSPLLSILQNNGNSRRPFASGSL